MTYPTMFEILTLLEQKGIHYRVDAFQPDVMTITASVPGQLWEIQCHSDASPDIEIFVSQGPVRQVGSIEPLKALTDEWAD